MRRDALRFRGGGSLDGAELELPPGITSVVTTKRDGTRSYYELDDSGAFSFAGLNNQGATMGKIMRVFSEAARAEREAIEAAMRPVGCRSCGRTYGSRSAYLVHFQAGEGSRCLDGDARGQLVERSGVYCLPGSDASRR